MGPHMLAPSSVRLAVALCLSVFLSPSLSWSDAPKSVRYALVDGTTSLDTSGGADANTPFAIASIGKMMTAVAVLRLAERGQLSLDASPAQWFDQSVQEGLPTLAGTTIRQLLTMTSGLPDYYDDLYLEDALTSPEQTQRGHVALSYAFDQRPMIRPGRGFDYSNTNYLLLGLVLERVTGRSYAQVMRQEVLGPAGMTQSFVFGSRGLPSSFPRGHEDGQHYRDYYQGQGFGDGGVIASAPDLARFLNALLIERSLLSTNSLGMMLTDANGADYGMGIEVEGNNVGHSGEDLGFSSDARVNLSTGDLAIILVADADADTDWAFWTVK